MSLSVIPVAAQTGGMREKIQVEFDSRVPNRAVHAPES